MDNDLFDYTPIVEREPIHWPGGARVAFYVGLNIEHFHVDSPSTSLWEGTASLVPDPLNYGWRDYGPRVAIWRLIETLDRHGIRASALLNSDVSEHYPQIIEAGRARDWAWLAHGKTNSSLHTGMHVDEERALITDIVETIEAATGRRPRGWLGPGLTETFQTPTLLAELGLRGGRMVGPTTIGFMGAPFWVRLPGCSREPGSAATVPAIRTGGLRLDRFRCGPLGALAETAARGDAANTPELFRGPQ
jgi:polysaccharide deacetylase